MSEIKGDPASLALTNLCTFLKSNLTDVKEVRDQWPYANEKLSYPTITVTHVTKPKRTPEMKYQISITTPDVDKKVVANEVVASWDLNLQLDVWCRDKLQRKQITEEIILLFNSQEEDASGSDNPDGLSLQCSDLFNEWIRYEIDDFEAMDDEPGAQREERREKITVMVNFREVRQRTYYAIINLDVHQHITTEEKALDDSDTNVEIDSIF